MRLFDECALPTTKVSDKRHPIAHISHFIVLLYMIPSSVHSIKKKQSKYRLLYKKCLTEG